MAGAGGLCEGRVVVVTGAGRGLGRSYALALSAAGARVVVNDLGVEPDGTRPDPEVARRVTETIRQAGGEAVDSGEDVACWEGAARVVETALSSFGRLDAVVNNAGVWRDGLLVNLDEADLDEVVRVHLKGHAAMASQAAAHWRRLAADEGPSDWRIVNTTSPMALLASPPHGRSGHGAYVAAKAAVAALTLTEADELSRYGVMVNAIAPAARTRLTEALGYKELAVPEAPGAFDALDPDNVAPLVCWLCSVRSRGVNGCVFEIEGGRLGLLEGWRRVASHDSGERLVADELDGIVARLVSEAG